MQNYTLKYKPPTTQDTGEDETLRSYEGVLNLDPDFANYTFRDLMKRWSREARYVVWLLLDSPREILGLLGSETPTVIQRTVKKHLVQIGYEREVINRVFDELKAHLS